MARVTWTNCPGTILVQPHLSLEERLGELTTIVSLGSNTLFREDETLQDSPGEYETRLYQIGFEPGESGWGYMLPIEDLRDFEGFQPAGINQLLALKDMHPDLQLEKAIWAPGESFVRGGTHSIGIKEILAAKDGLITSSERIEPAYGVISHYKRPDRTVQRHLGLKHLCWLSLGAALFVKRV